VIRLSQLINFTDLMKSSLEFLQVFRTKGNRSAFWVDIIVPLVNPTERELEHKEVI
jgi:hypothetical protein